MRDDRAWLRLLLGFAPWGGSAVIANTPRGIRNNNPMNLRRTRDQWLGLATQQTDPEYFQFIDLPHGLRAGGRVLLTYAERYGLRTVGGIVARYAPEHENPTDAYIDNVARDLNVRPGTKAGGYVDGDPIDVARRLRELMRSITKQENGAAAAMLHVPPSAYDAALMLLGLEVR